MSDTPQEHTGAFDSDQESSQNADGTHNPAEGEALNASESAIPTQPYATMNGGVFPYAPQPSYAGAQTHQPMAQPASNTASQPATQQTAFQVPAYQPQPYPVYPPVYPQVPMQTSAYAGLISQTPIQAAQQPAFYPQFDPQLASAQVTSPQGTASQATQQQAADDIVSAAGSAPRAATDYSHFDNPARIAIYDDLRSAPRIIQVQGGPTHEFIERIASLTYQNARDAGGLLPYTVIREVSENFIHADFTEVVVSILDHGNTIRFSDQGPGIHNKELVQQPGFTSATEPMKRFIRGVGSGFPLMNDYLQASKGHYTIEDNVDGGAVVTISLMPDKAKIPTASADAIKATENEKAILKALLPRQVLGVTELHNATGIANSSIHAALTKMEESGLVMKEGKSKRVLTDIGYEMALALQTS